MCSQAMSVQLSSIADASGKSSVPAVLVALCITQSAFILWDRAAYLMQARAVASSPSAALRRASD